MNIRKQAIFIAVILAISFIGISYANSKYYDYEYIDLNKISRYFEDRIAYQQIQKDVGTSKDNSLSSLLIIKDKKMYLIKDGYEDPKDVQIKKLTLDMSNNMVNDLWTNKINGKPDFIRITERRVELLKNYDEEYVTKNFGTFYKSVRNAFIQKHVNIFTKLMLNRKESQLYVKRQPAPRPVYLGAPKEVKYSITVAGKTYQDIHYYAEDADGDGITETFFVNSADGFHWGFKSGPNMIMIYNNQIDEVKQIIGNLTKNAYYGTPEEEKGIIQTFPKDSDIIRDFELESVVKSSAAK